MEGEVMPKNNDIKVSIIVPVFNVKPYLRECLDSILCQALKDIEVLCGDGGSNDGSLEILREYEKRDSRIKVISKEGSGYGQSVNDCVKIARGKYIGIVESDDVVKNDMYEVLYNLAEDNDLDWIRGDIYLYYSMLEADQRLKRESIIYGGDFYNVILDPQTDYRPYKSGLRHWSGIYNLDFLKNNCIYHNETPGGSYQDVGFYLKTLWYANRVMFVDQAFYMWRQDNPTSSVHYDSKKLVDKSLNEWKLDKDFLRAHKELGKRAWCSYRYRQFFSYRWTLEMARGPEVERVLREFRKEYAEAAKREEIDRGFFDDYEWALLCDFLRENRIKINSEEKSKLRIGENLVRIWMKVGGRILRPYKNYIRRIIDASIEEAVRRITEQIDSVANKTNEGIIGIQNIIEKSDYESRRRTEELMQRLNSKISSLEIESNHQYGQIHSEVDKLKRSIADNNEHLGASINSIVNNIQLENNKLCEFVEAGKTNLDESLSGVRNRVEDVYHNLDLYVIHPEYGRDEQNKNAISNVARLLLKSNNNKTICSEYLNSIEIEVFSKCNRKCWFCPNSIIDRSTENHYMPENIYLKILDELKQINYSRTISFSRYNEPLLDRIILKRIEQARKYCPTAYIRTNTNGDFLDSNYLNELKQVGLNELEIQCYYGEKEDFSKEEFVLRLQQLVHKLDIETYELLDTPSDRYKAELLFDGMKVYYFALNMTICANNRGEVLDKTVLHRRNQNCLVPFKNLYVDYTSKYMMCCNVRSDIEDHTRFVVGDAKEDKLWDVFMSEKMLQIRQKCAIASNMTSPCTSCCYYTRDDDMNIF